MPGTRNQLRDSMTALDDAILAEWHRCYTADPGEAQRKYGSGAEYLRQRRDAVTFTLAATAKRQFVEAVRAHGYNSTAFERAQEA